MLSWLLKRCNTPITHAKVVAVLIALGFEKHKKQGKGGGSGHEHWKKVVAGHLYKVTTDSHTSPYGEYLIKSMAHQAGLSLREFCSLVKKENLKKLKNGLFTVKHRPKPWL